jgi:hypothetical protein
MVVEEPTAAADRPVDGTVMRPSSETRSEPREDEDEESLPASPMTMQDGIRAVHQAIVDAPTPPRWPMYVRQAKQFLRQSIEGFDERKYGFSSVVDLLRAAGKEGVLRIERDRQGAIRVFPGANLGSKPRAADAPIDIDETVDVEVPPDSVVEPTEAEVVESTMTTSPIESVEIEVEAPAVADAVVIGETDEDNEPQPNVTPDGRPVGSRGAGAGGGGKAKRSGGGSRGGGGRKPIATTRQPRVAAVEAQRHAKTTKLPRARKRASGRAD